MKKRFFAVLAALVLLVGLGLPSASTAAYPDRPITLVLPVGAGGSHDLHARGITSIIADILGQPMVVKLVPGGAGMKGTGFVAKAKPDGYTLLFSHNGFDQLVPQRARCPSTRCAIFRLSPRSTTRSRCSSPCRTGRGNP